MGSIPAQAGEPGVGLAPVVRGRVYPRAGGGTPTATYTLSSARGLSPRRRGNLKRIIRFARLVGSIPAQAGEPMSLDTRFPDERVYPRAGGGTKVTQVNRP